MFLQRELLSVFVLGRSFIRRINLVENGFQKWGCDPDKDYGGNSAAVQAALTGVETIYSTWLAFAALLNDGRW